MYNLYFKLNDNNIYMRSMQYMTAINRDGKEVVEFYNPELFIFVEEYFKQAEYIGRISSYDITNEHFILLYDSNMLGIGYNIDTDVYEIIPHEVMELYRSSYNYIWDYENQNVSIEPTEIVRTMLKKRREVFVNKINGRTSEELEYEIKKLERIK